MTIHDMLKSAATDLTAMDIKMRTLESQIEATEKDNERLRKAHAEAETRRIHAEADLVHYQNIFVASVCMEAMSICKQMFEITHTNVRKRAEEAVQRMVEEKLEKEREQSAAKPASDIDEDNSFQPEIEQAPAKSSPVPQDGAIVQAPFGMTNAEVKKYYRYRMDGFLPTNWEIRPIFTRTPEGWKETKRDLSPPSFLSKREPREDLRGGVSKLGLMLFGG